LGSDPDNLSSLSADELNGRIASLCVEKERLETDYARRLTSITALQERKSALESRISALRADGQALEQSITDLTEQRSAFESQLSRIAVELSEVQAQTERQTLEVEARSITVSAFTEKVQQSTEFLRVAESEIQRLMVSKFTTAIDLPTGAVTGIAFGPNCQSIVAIGQNRRFCQFGLPALGELANFSTVAVANGFRLHPDGQRVALAGADNAARLISVHTGRVLTELGGHSEMCTDCQWASPNQLMSASRDR
jgi:WD40 repeat protein